MDLSLHVTRKGELDQRQGAGEMKEARGGGLVFLLRVSFGGFATRESLISFCFSKFTLATPLLTMVWNLGLNAIVLFLFNSKNRVPVG